MITHRIVVTPRRGRPELYPVDATQTDPGSLCRVFAAARCGCDVRVEPVERPAIPDGLRRWAA